ncbi:MAG: VWA domain-containing protein [Methylococcus sp.]|nr:MAG: VWA domain-containing protein [Methylococcus sp.]
MKRLRRIAAWLNRHWRTLLLVLASLLVGLCLLQPQLTLPRHVHRYQVVFDITQSMNTQDYRVSGLPRDRLGYAKAALRQALHELPCGSEVGLGLFTTQTVHFLFEPLEICGHFGVIDDVLEHIDWRMAWSADTHVEMGLYHALREMEKRDPGLRLVFLTDGQETPPQTVQPRFDGKPGAAAGAIIGVGGLAPVTVPHYDRENQLLGVWENADIEKPPVSTTVYSEKVVTRVLPAEGPYLSWLDEPHLKAIAAATGLTYQRLDAAEPFVDFLTSPGLAELRATPTQAAPYLAGLALLLLLLAHAIEPARAKKRRTPS